MIRTVSLNGSFEYISLLDDAIDTEHPDFKEQIQKYAEGTVPHPPLKDGKEPTRFTLRQCGDSDLFAYLHGFREREGDHSWFVHVASFCLESVVGLKDEKGDEWRIEHERMERWQCISKKDRDALMPVLKELGQAVVIRTKSPNRD